VKIQPTIEAAPPRKWGPAIRFLASGRRRDPIAKARAEVFRQLIDQRGQANVRLWWSRRKRRCLAAAAVIENPGKTGMLFHSPATAEGVHAQSLVALLQSISLDALRRGMTVVQALIAEDQRRDAEILEEAGLERLARLLTLKLKLADAPRPQDAPSLSWRNHGEFSDAELGELIAQTYRGSLDCPALAGVRKIEDVIAGHKAAGVFLPEAWWIVVCDGAAAGCILVNDSPTAPLADIIYIGVLSQYRGRGIGRAMLQRAVAQANERRRSAICLAVDARNSYARRLYEALGFRRTDVRVAYAALPERPSGGLIPDACEQPVE